MIEVYPAYKESEDIIRTKTWSSSIGEKICRILTFLIGFRFIPGTKCLSNERWIPLALYALLNFSAQHFKSMRYIIQCLSEFFELLLMLF